MNKKYFFTTFVFIIIGSMNVEAQFWKLNQMSDRELFILDARATMAAGICYKEEPTTSLDPALKFQTISYCCDGYERDVRSASMKCSPFCSEDCTNGICTAPDVCECYPGYERIGGRCEEL